MNDLFFLEKDRRFEFISVSKSLPLLLLNEFFLFWFFPF